MRKIQKTNQGYTKKRENFSHNLRKSIRESVYSKNRSIKQNQIEEQSQQNQSYTIIDQRFSQHILMFTNSYFQPQDLLSYIKLAQATDIKQIHIALIAIRTLIKIENQQLIQLLIDKGFINNLVNFVQQQQYPQIKLEALWILANITQSCQSHCQSVVNNGMIPIFVKLLNSQHIQIISQSIWGIGNISLDSIQNRDMMIAENAINNLIQVTKMQNRQINQNVTWALSNMMRGHPQPNYEIVEAGLLFLVNRIIKEQIQEQQTIDCLWAINENIKQSVVFRNQLIQLQFHRKFCTLLDSQNNIIVSLTIKTIGRLLQNKTQKFSQIIMNSEILNYIELLVGHQKKIVRVQSCKCFIHLLQAQMSFIHYFINNQDFISRLINYLQTDVQEVKIQICHIINNIANSSPQLEVYNFLYQHQIPKYFLDLLRSSNTQLILICVQSLQMILKLGNLFKLENSNNLFAEVFKSEQGLTILEDLQFNPNQQIYQHVTFILQTYFEPVHQP